MTIESIPGVFGLRDIGGMPAAGGRTRRGRLFRSGELSGVDDDGARMLRAGVRRIVDLRSDDEVASAATAVPGVDIVRVPLFLGSPASFFFEDLTLGEVYERMLVESAASLVTAVRMIARGDPTLVHCTAGKDRTGLTIALALSAVGADRGAVVADYALTGELISHERRSAEVVRLRAKYPDSRNAASLVTESPAPVMRETLTGIEERWGGAAGYLRTHGLTADELAALRRALVEPGSPGIPASDPEGASL
ncbi:tyrosine-protein phosphatase [Microbacterium sp. NPDC057659]|uniref:tyrosine-protein phosphatase n=1 Tax=Microbacterium sp. NPDC057659 TaxID=3346198 RepID=UPI003670DFE0